MYWQVEIGLYWEISATRPRMWRKDIIVATGMRQSAPASRTQWPRIPVTRWRLGDVWDLSGDQRKSYVGSIGYDTTAGPVVLRFRHAGTTQTERTVNYEAVSSNSMMNRNRKYCNFIPRQQPKPGSHVPSLFLIQKWMIHTIWKRNNTDAF